MDKALPFFLVLSSIFFNANAQTFTEILGRPTNHSATLSTLFSVVVETYVEFGTAPGDYSQSTTTVTSTDGTPVLTEIEPLLPNTRYYYRTRYKIPGSPVFQAGQEHSFHTCRAPGTSFRFDIEADEHLYDKKGVASIYQLTLANEASDSADFLITLGDIFGDDHTPLETTSADMDFLHKDYLQYLGQVCHSMPLFVCLGNHEGESGYWLDQTPPDNIAVYGTLWRKFYYPNPVPDDFYSGNMIEESYGIGLPENYYAWTWGDALFVVLDVYRDCDVDEKPKNWDWTIGETQYNWLKNTLENSTAKYKFVFAHHLRGQGRGAVDMATGFEWGGYNNNGEWEFDQYRPGWAMPIHQLMVMHGVNIFFQGHDHLYAREVLDGLVYQETPMPSDSTYEIGVLANADAYTDLTLGGTGHLRVTVDPNCVTVDFIRSYLPADTLDGQHHNGEIAYSYTVGDCSLAVSVPAPDLGGFSISPNPAKDLLRIEAEKAMPCDRPVDVLDAFGRPLRSAKLMAAGTVCQMSLDGLAPGVYWARMREGDGSYAKKFVIF